MFCGLVLGGLGALALVKIVRHRRRWHGGHGGGCHRGGWGHGMHGHRGGWRRGPWWLVRELKLDRKQREALWSIAGDVREAVYPLKQAGREGRDVVIQALAADDFDRARLEEFAARQEAAIGQARGTIIDALDRAHTVLTSEQRTKLRELLARMGFGGFGDEGGGGPPFGAGPYRTAL